MFTVTVVVITSKKVRFLDYKDPSTPFWQKRALQLLLKRVKRNSFPVLLIFLYRPQAVLFLLSETNNTLFDPRFDKRILHISPDRCYNSLLTMSTFDYCYVWQSTYINL